MMGVKFELDVADGVLQSTQHSTRGGGAQAGSAMKPTAEAVAFEMH
jgi:hypothetical protein